MTRSKNKSYLEWLDRLKQWMTEKKVQGIGKWIQSVFTGPDKAEGLYPKHSKDNEQLVWKVFICECCMSAMF